MRQYSQLFCLGLQIWISEMLQYHPELEVVELVQDGRDSSEIIYFQLHTLIHSFLILQSHTNDDP